MNDEILLTPEEVSERLKISLRKAQDMAGKRITAIRVGNEWRFRPSDIQAYLEAQTKPAGGSTSPA